MRDSLYEMVTVKCITGHFLTSNCGRQPGALNTSGKHADVPHAKAIRYARHKEALDRMSLSIICIIEDMGVGGRPGLLSEDHSCSVYTGVDGKSRPSSRIGILFEEDRSSMDFVEMLVI